MKLMHPFKSYRLETKSVIKTDDDDADGDMIPMCRPCFAGDTTILRCIMEKRT